MKEILKREFPLTATDIDNHRRCRLSALLSYMQNMATEHAVLLGVGRETIMAEYNAFWVMARLQLALSRPITFDDETIEIHTWHRGVTKGPSVYRDFDLILQGERIGEGTISWVLVDMDTRKIMKPGAVPPLVNSPKPEVLKEIIPARVKMPENLTQAMVRPVYYSDIDINGHMNNTKYADIACDAIELHRHSNRFISEVQINYLSECFPGEELLVLAGEGAGAHYIQGTDKAGKTRFDVEMRLLEIPQV